MMVVGVGWKRQQGWGWSDGDGRSGGQDGGEDGENDGDDGNIDGGYGDGDGDVVVVAKLEAIVVVRITEENR